MRKLLTRMILPFWNPMFFTILPMVLVFALPFAIVQLMDLGPDVVAATAGKEPAEDGSSASGSGDPDLEPRPRSGSTRKEPAQKLIETIVNDRFRRPDEVAVGRFLADFDKKVDHLSAYEESELKLAQRGVTWVLVDAVPPEGTPPARLRYVRHEDAWKLEHIELNPPPLPAPRTPSERR